MGVLRVAAVGALAAVLGCTKQSSSSGGGGDRGVAEHTFKVTVQNGQDGNASLAIRGGHVASTPAGIDCGVAPHAACSAEFAVGTTVTLAGYADTATTPPTIVLLWAGDCSGIAQSCALTTGASDRYVVVVFGSEAERTAHSNFTDPSIHGPAWAAYAAGSPGALDCKWCHGASLQGQGLAVSCSGCHGWPLPVGPVLSWDRSNWDETVWE